MMDWNGTSQKVKRDQHNKLPLKVHIHFATIVLEFPRRDGCDQHCIASQPVRRLARNGRKARLQRQRASTHSRARSPDSSFAVSAAKLPKVLGQLREYSVFLETVT